jgi:2'-5' RNA ligase
VAVWPPEAVVARLRALPRDAHPGLRWTTEPQWHVTLRFLGAVAEETIEGVSRRLARAAATARPTEAIAGPRAGRLGPGVLALPVGGLDRLAAEVGAALGPDREGPARGRPFRGHLTLARARRPAALATVALPELAATWPVEGITLVRSDLRPDGAVYTVLGRWPLGRPDP